MSPDISMCSGENCPIKKRCYRFKAKQSRLQVFFVTPPVKTDGTCDRFWEVRK